MGVNWGEAIVEAIAGSDFFIVLLSARSINSEMVIEEVRLARESRRERGRPHYLPLRVRHSGSLGYALGAYLQGYQWRAWQSVDDSDSILREILDIAVGTISPPLEQSPSPGDSAIEMKAPDRSTPKPRADLSDLSAPGGAMRPDDPFYIERDADAEILAAAQRLKETLVIQGSRQNGKSSLLKRYLTACHREGKKIALIDMSLCANSDLADYVTFLNWIVADLLDKLELEIDAPEIRTQAGLTRFIQRQLLKAVTDPLVLAFDEVDRVLGQGYQSDFFSMLRYWHERRTDTPSTNWARTEMILVISTETYLLIDKADRSPFNIRAPIELRPFNQEESRELNGKYGDFLSEHQLERLWELLEGHPYLVQRAYYLMTRPRPMDFDALCHDAHLEEGPFGDHLRGVTIKLRRHGGQDLIAALRQIIKHGTVNDEDAFQRLRGAGLARRREGRIVPANQLYARFFGDMK